MSQLPRRILAISLLLLNGCALLSRTPAPDSSEANAAVLNLQLGVGYMQQGNFAIALEKLKKALDYNDEFAEAHNAIAVLYEETKQEALADQHYRRAIELDPQYTLARLNYGRFLCAHGKTAEGERQFLMVADDSKPESSEAAYTGAGFCARLAHDMEQAETHLRKALEQNPQSPGALLEMAQVDHAQGKDLEASAFLERYHKIAGYDAKSLWLGIEIAGAVGNNDLRREYTRILVTQFEGSNEARRLNPQ
jgi:type IV pilus assembly protein PilF